MTRLFLFLTGCGAVLISLPSAEGAKTHASSAASGRDAVAAVRHDWKKSTPVLRTTQGVFRLSGAVPKNFGTYSIDTRLQYLHARRDLAPRRFDRNHPSLGRILARDDRARAALAQDCHSMNGLVPNTSHWRYLQYRRSLAPRRFDFYHPALGAILAEDQRLRNHPVCPPKITMPLAPTAPPTAFQGLIPPGVPSPGGPIGGGTNPPPSLAAVPEPASLAMMLLGAAGVGVSRVIARRRLRRATLV